MRSWPGNRPGRWDRGSRPRRSKSTSSSRTERAHAVKAAISAFVCEPGAGSEPGAAWSWAAAAAERHDVWLITDPRNREAIEAEILRRPELRIEPMYLELPSWTGGPWTSTSGLRNRYVVWQHVLRRAINDLH